MGIRNKFFPLDGKFRVWPRFAIVFGGIALAFTVQAYMKDKADSQHALYEKILAERMTPDQISLENVWRTGRYQYAEAKNEVQKSAVFVDVSQKTYSLLTPTKGDMIGWYLTVKEITTDHGGSSVTVKFASPSGIEYRDLDDHAKGSDIYTSLADLKVGDCVNVSGALVHGGRTEGGVTKWEESLTEEGALKEPIFDIKVDEIRKANPPSYVTSND